MTPLFPYQEDAIKEIVGSKASYLAFEQGLGKTRVAIEVAMRMGATRVLVPCPATVRLVWEQEIKKWWPGHPEIQLILGTKDIGKLSGPGIFVISYGLLSLSRAGIDYASAIKKAGTKEPFDLTILDEAHSLTRGDPDQGDPPHHAAGPRPRASDVRHARAQPLG